MMHIYRPRHFQRTWFGVNWHIGYWVPTRARFQKPLFQISEALIMPMVMPMIPPSANCYDVAHLQVKTVAMNLIWIESAQWLLSYGICKSFAGRRARETDEEHAINPFFPSERVGDNKVISEVIPGIQLFLPTTWKAHHSPWLYFRPYRT